MKAKLYLLPCPLGDVDPSRDVSKAVYEAAQQLRHFVVEREKTARRFLKQLDLPYPISEAQLYEIDKHNANQDLNQLIAPLLNGQSMGLISEAGCPAVADPGAEIVKIAQQKGISVVPLVGPSSILLALMAAGFNGQSFAFNGYLPIDKNERSKKIKQLEHRVLVENQTQLFMDTPFRNEQLLDDLILNCKPSTMLCIAMDISLENESIKTNTLAYWSKNKPKLHKHLVMFVLGK